MKAITVTYHGATATKPDRYIARDGDNNRVTVSIHACRGDARTYAARELCKKMNWKGKLVSGWLNGNTYVFVFLNQ